MGTNSESKFWRVPFKGRKSKKESVTAPNSFSQKIRRNFDEYAEQSIKGSILYTSGLIDEAFLAGPLDFQSKEYLMSLVRMIHCNKTNLGEYGRDMISLLMKKGILTSSHLQHRIVTPGTVPANILAYYLSPPNEEVLKTVKFLVTEGILNEYTLWNLFLTNTNQGIFSPEGILRTDWKAILSSGVIDPNKINRITLGLDAVEPTALSHDISNTSTRSNDYSMGMTMHPTALKLRAQEHEERISKQIEEVVGKKPRENIIVQMNTVFDYYLKKAPLLKEMEQRDRIPSAERDAERNRNISLVNAMQKEFVYDSRGTVAKPAAEANKRYIDIYGRYGPYGHMDPLQLFFIARTIEWYVTGNRARLFNGIRAVPYRITNEHHMPWIILAAAPSAKLLRVSGGEFINSMMGANRTFLTHSVSQDASNMGSIPIIGTATAESSTKRVDNPDEVVIFHADFDPKDTWRRRDAYAPEHLDPTKRRWKKAKKIDVAGDIAGLINETLRVLMECEEKEIARATKAKNMQKAAQFRSFGSCV